MRVGHGKEPALYFEKGYWKTYYKGWIFLGLTVEKSWANYKLWNSYNDNPVKQL